MGRGSGRAIEARAMKWVVVVSTLLCAATAVILAIGDHWAAAGGVAAAAGALGAGGTVRVNVTVHIRR